MDSKLQINESDSSSSQQLILRIISENGSRELKCQRGTILLDVLVQQGYRLPSPCGGAGRCGKCRVKVVQDMSEAEGVCCGAQRMSLAEEAYISKREPEEGWHLACRLTVEQDMTVFVPEEKDYQIAENGIGLAAGERQGLDVVAWKQRMVRNQEYEMPGIITKLEKQEVSTEYTAAIDIGTTTLVFQLLDKTAQKVLHTVSMLNRQRSFGADVISRIQASNAGKREELAQAIRADLKSGMENLWKESGVDGTKISRIAIGANTTMVYLLLGYDCSALGSYPFQAINLSMQRTTWQELVGENAGCTAETIILPGISAFVGGDIVAGLYACGFERREKLALLIDLGTNGEMVLGNRERLLVTSTAAGPAFEGGNLSCGTGSVAGAVCGAEWKENRMQVKTLWDAPVVGICGTGVVELVAELLHAGLVDETGLLVEEYFETGFSVANMEDGRKLVFTQDDIRELQLAKAAIRAGIEVLLSRYGVRAEQVETVYLAGGFGYGLNTDKAIAIGLLPEAFREKVQAVGNSCIAGLGRFLRENAENTVKNLVESAAEINLALDEEFHKRYIDAMFLYVY